MSPTQWIDWAQVLGIPSLAVAVSFATYRSGHWQVRIAREKLRHDLYERRYAIYRAFYDLLVAIGEKDDVESELKRANIARGQSPFLLERRLRLYLERIYEEAHRIHTESKQVYEQNLWSRERSARAARLVSDRTNLAGRVKELIREFDCLRLTDLSRDR
jgi:hypothetical protein